MKSRSTEGFQRRWPVALLATVVVVLGTLFGVTSQAAAVDVSRLEIIEGVGAGYVVTLGMTGEQVNAVATNGNCASADTCSFRLTPETAVITVSFDPYDLVKRIEINQNNVADKWPTAKTGIVIDHMSLAQVADLYGDWESVIEGDQVAFAEHGYTYYHRVFCVYQNVCSRVTN